MGSGQADHTISVDIKHIVEVFDFNLPIEIKVAPTIDINIESSDIPLQIDHRQILGVALKTPTVAESVPISIENPAIAYDSGNDWFDVQPHGDQGLPFAQEAVTGKLQCIVE